MRVLIVDFDVVGARGGGQTVYSKIIAKSLDRTFYFFSRRVETLTQLTDNSYAIPFRETYVGRDVLPSELAPFYGRYVSACQFAESARAAGAPSHFDVVDVPDYLTEAAFFRPVLLQHGITTGVVALALHGTISFAFEGDWKPAAVSRPTLEQIYAFERSQFEACDVRYAISAAYADRWRRATGHASRQVDPLHVVGDFTAEALALQSDDSARKPDLVCIGRRERLKGQDIAIDLAYAAGPENFRSLRIIGNEATGVTGTPSRPILERAARLRHMAVDISTSMPFAELEQLFCSRTIVLLPSRIDSFNLVALEALRRGCPVFVSRHAGVARWIETQYPALSDLVIDLGCGRGAARTLRNAAQNYDVLRARIAAEITRNPLVAARDDLALMYEPLEAGAAALRQSFDRLAELFERDHKPRRSVTPVPVLLTAPNLEDVATPPAPPPDPDAEAAADRAHHIAAIGSYGPKLSGLIGLLPISDDEFRRFLSFFNEAIGMHRTGRVEVFGQMAALERSRKNPLTAALYDLRATRWRGGDASGSLESMKRAFRAEGFALEAEAVEAMYGDDGLAHQRCAAFIEERFKACLVRPDRPFQFIDDRRGDAEPKVSVIVSLYNAASKLPTLVENVSIQTLARDGLVEIVLVDSGSPTNEYAVFQSIADQFDLPVVFARSRERETIQAAWNRGIGLAKAPYLCFYGVDEGMHPDCLERLARVLDDDVDVDWVMADSLVTDVDAEGVFAGDVMPYDRKGLDREMVYLETCYLSWVGGLYRRSIHERFGYYDESFRAAGDTEFKCRVLGRITIKHVPQMLGIFNNYPEERTTAHPRAEIEDQRAWYLHRTSAGMANLFDGRDIGAAEGLFRRCLGYKKTYCQHVSTDFDLAAAVLAYMERRGDNPDFVTKAKPISDRLAATMSSVDSESLSLPIDDRQARLHNTYDELAALAASCETIFGLDTRPTFRIFNDNRFEQHWWSWSVSP